MQNKQITSGDVLRAFTYSDPTPETVTIAGVPVEIWRDDMTDMTESPYLDEGMAPALWLTTDGRLEEYGGGNLDDFFARVKPGWVSRHWRAIARLLDLSESSVDAECHQNKADYGGDMADTRREYFADCLLDMKSESWGYAVDYLETLRALYRLAGIPAETFQKNGYCHGDSIYGLIVHLPEWRESVGFGGDSYPDMASEAAIYADWVFGGVYGYTVEDESCGGFYGRDSAYFAETIAGSVNYILTRRAESLADSIAESRPDMTAPHKQESV